MMKKNLLLIIIEEVLIEGQVRDG